MRNSLIVTAFSLAALASHPARAQPAAPPSQTDGDQPAVAPVSANPVSPANQAQISEIVVTASRRSENLQKVPVTVESVQASVLKALALTNLVDLPQLVSGFETNRLGISSVSFLRGVGANNGGFTTEPPVATYFDGFYIPYSGASSFGFNNIERVEVLKGPQGTLYGRNTTGGLVSVITRDPGDKPRIDASLGYANYDTKSFNFYGSTPVTDTLGANLSITRTKQDQGWARNIFTGDETMKDDETGVEGKLLWKPSPLTRITLEASYDLLNTDQGNAQTVYPGSVGIDGTPYLGPYRISYRFDPNALAETGLVGLKAEQDLGFANASSLTSYQHARAHSLTNIAGVPGQPVAGEVATASGLRQFDEAFTQEFQLQSKKSNPSSKLSWILGFFYFHDKAEAQFLTDTSSACVGIACVTAATPTITTGYPTTVSYSGFGEGTYNLTSSTRLTLGVRYTSDEKALSGSTIPLPGLPNSVPVLPSTVLLRPGAPYPGNPNGIATDVTFTAPTYRAVLAQDLSENINAYVSFNHGFKSGGYSPSVFNNQPAKPEFVNAYEVGIKSELLDRRLRLNLAAFYYDYDDIQLRTSAPPAPPNGSILYNAASAKMKGVDADFEYRPIRNLSITGNAEYLDAIYTKFPNAICAVPAAIAGKVLGGNVSVACNDSGRSVIDAPKYSYTLGFLYSIETDDGRVSLSANDSYKGKFFWDPSNRISQPAYSLVNASLTWTAPGGRYDIQLWGKNLSGSYYFVYGAESTSDLGSAGAPRTFGVSFGYHY